MLSIINKSLRSGDTHLSEAKYVVDCNADVIPERQRRKFARTHADLKESRNTIAAKAQGGALSCIQVVPAASDYKSSAKDLRSFAQRLADEAHETRIGAISTSFYAADEEQNARITRTLLEEGYSCAPRPPAWTYEDIGGDKVTGADASFVIGLDARRRDRRKSTRH